MFDRSEANRSETTGGRNAAKRGHGEFTVASLVRHRALAESSCLEWSWEEMLILRVGVGLAPVVSLRDTTG
jgi:hypothetical protein